MPPLRKLCCFLVLIFGFTSVCAEEQENNDYLASHLVNWKMTSSQYLHCQNQVAATDKHFLLGECPSSNVINMYYASTALIHYTAANLLPRRYSRALKDSSINFQFSMFKEHSSLGMSVNF